MRRGREDWREREEEGEARREGEPFSNPCLYIQRKTGIYRVQSRYAGEKRSLH